jgi:competence protein ComEC
VALALVATVDAERQRLALWLPVPFGLGILVYFALPTHPTLADAAIVAGVGTAFFVVGWWRRFARMATVVLAVASCGFLAAALRAEGQSAPTIERRIGPIVLTGRILAIEATEKGQRITLDEVVIARLAPSATPAKVRISDRIAANRALVPGARIRIAVVLQPPPEPAAPSAFDFARDAWFQRIGAFGYSVGVAQRLEEPGATPAVWVARFRHTIGRRILDALPGAAGSIAAALVMGDRAAIPEPDLVALRDSGLAHLLSISGLHMSLVAGIVFFGVRLGFAAWPAVALRYPTKKWAAVGALLAASAYLAISGASVPAQRSFITVAIVLGAVLIERSAVSMRLLAVAALAVLLVQPESLLGPSFQMSFAAVLALIAGHEVVRGRWNRFRSGAWWGGRVLLYVAGIAFTTVLASAATTPFAVYHFGRLVSYGAIANLVAVPLTGFWIMPAAMLALVLMPFGLEGVPLWLMGRGVEAVLWTARLVSSWPDAALSLPAMSRLGILSATAGLLWLCLWRCRWRLIGVPFVIAGMVTPAFYRAPDLYVTSDGRQIGVRLDDGGLAVSGDPKSFETQIWLRRDGLAAAAPWTSSGEVRCDRLGCLAERKGYRLAFVRDQAALADDCRVAELIVAPMPVLRCPSARTILDSRRLRRSGAIAVWLGPDGVEVRSSVEARGDRPWVRQVRERAPSSGGRGRPGAPEP